MPSDQACKQFVEDLHNSYVAKRLAAFEKRKSSDVPKDTCKKAAAARLKFLSKAIKTRHQLFQVRRRKAVAAKEEHKKDGMHSIRKLKERLGRS